MTRAFCHPETSRPAMTPMFNTHLSGKLHLPFAFSEQSTVARWLYSKRAKRVFVGILQTLIEFHLYLLKIFAKSQWNEIPHALVDVLSMMFLRPCPPFHFLRSRLRLSDDEADDEDLDGADEQTVFDRSVLLDSSRAKSFRAAGKDPTCKIVGTGTLQINSYLSVVLSGQSTQLFRGTVGGKTWLWSCAYIR